MNVSLSFRDMVDISYALPQQKSNSFLCLISRGQSQRDLSASAIFSGSKLSYFGVQYFRFYQLNIYISSWNPAYFCVPNVTSHSSSLPPFLPLFLQASRAWTRKAPEHNKKNGLNWKQGISEVMGLLAPAYCLLKRNSSLEKMSNQREVNNTH